MSRRVYAARVKDQGTNPKWGGDWHRIVTRTNPLGEWSTRRGAQAALDAAKRNDHDLAGHTFTYVVDVPLTLETVRIDDWVIGDVVPISVVPEEFRANYKDTLKRVALAGYRAKQKVFLSDSFRAREVQEQRWATYLAGGALAARPGTSPHEKGDAVDIPNGRANKPLANELRKLGMIDDVPVEGWHFTNHN